MPAVGFGPTISVGERPQTYALNREPTGTGMFMIQGTFIHLSEFVGVFTICSSL